MDQLSPIGAPVTGQCRPQVIIQIKTQADSFAGGLPKGREGLGVSLSIAAMKIFCCAVAWVRSCFSSRGGGPLYGLNGVARLNKIFD